MVMFSLKELKAAAPNGKPSILKAIVDYSELFEEYDVNTPRRLRYFLAQCAHESAGFRVTEEYASGKAYEGRRDLGNIHKGDGVKYKGRGLIQLTGRYNYRKYGKIMGLDIETNPELVKEFPIALEISLAYWKSHGLNKLADEGKFKTITRRINGGFNGLKDRERWLKRFQIHLSKEVWLRKFKRLV